MKKEWIKNNKCMIKGCTNKKIEGNFIGDMCVPCYDMITKGQMNPSNNFIYKLWIEYEELNKENFELKKEKDKLVEVLNNFSILTDQYFMDSLMKAVKEGEKDD